VPIDPGVAKLVFEKALEAEEKAGEEAGGFEQERAYEARRAKIIARGGDPDAALDSDDEDEGDSAFGDSYVSY